MKNDCVFCAIAAHEIPCFKIYEDERSIAFLDINPFSTGHALVVPKRHFAGLADIDGDELASLVEVTRKVASRIKEVLLCDGFNILQNNGEAAGQTVKHLHFHIVPRLAGDDLRFVSAKGDMGKLAALAESLRMA